MAHRSHGDVHFLLSSKCQWVSSPGLHCWMGTLTAALNSCPGSAISRSPSHTCLATLACRVVGTWASKGLWLNQQCFLQNTRSQVICLGMNSPKCLLGLVVDMFSPALISEREITKTSQQESVKDQLHFIRDPDYLIVFNGHFFGPWLH